ncbi:MAG: nitroreductase family protein [Christensenellaceae bacterium]|jgi:nitroreductase|nr:nitroreductase family protein [Christensenellaceae bacterium]
MINELFKKRRSIRKYDPSKIVSDDLIKQLLEAGMCAPSACNTRPWEFIVIKNDELIHKITEIHPYTQMIKTSQCAIIVVGLPNNQVNLPGANMWPQDCAAATENILLQATEFNLGSCWCGIYPTDRVAKFQSLLDLPSHKIPFNVIAIGYTAEKFGSRGFYEESKVKWLK